MRRQQAGLRIDEAAQHVGEEWVLRYSHARARIDGIETVKEPALGFHHAGGRNVRKVRITMLPRASYGEKTRLVRAQELIQPWAEWVAHQEEVDRRHKEVEAATMRLGHALMEVGINVDFLTWRGRGVVEVALRPEEADRVADLLAGTALGVDEEG